MHSRDARYRRLAKNHVLWATPGVMRTVCCRTDKSVLFSMAYRPDLQGRHSCADVGPMSRSRIHMHPSRSSSSSSSESISLPHHVRARPNPSEAARRRARKCRGRFVVSLGLYVGGDKLATAPGIGHTPVVVPGARIGSAAAFSRGARHIAAMERSTIPIVSTRIEMLPDRALPSAPSHIDRSRP